jgi:hypothetical protein
MRRWLLLALSVTLFSASPRSLSAATIKGTFNGPENGGTVTVQTNEGVNSKLSTYGNAGFMKWTVSSSQVPFDVPNGPGYLGFCIEYQQNVSKGSTYVFDVQKTASQLSAIPDPGVGSGAIGAVGATNLDRLFEVAYSTVVNAHDKNLANAKSLAASFQLAVWEIVYEAQYGNAVLKLSGANKGKFYAADGNTAGVVSQAQTWLDAITSSSPPTTDKWAVLAWTNIHRQDQIIALPGLDPNTVTVPEPASCALLVIGGVGAGACRFWRRRRVEMGSRI